MASGDGGTVATANYGSRAARSGLSSRARRARPCRLRSRLSARSAGTGRPWSQEVGAQLRRQGRAVAGAVEQRDEPAAEVVLDAHAGVAQVGHHLAGPGLVAREGAGPRGLARGRGRSRWVDVEHHEVGRVAAQQRVAQRAAVVRRRLRAEQVAHPHRGGPGARGALEGVDDQRVVGRQRRPGRSREGLRAAGAGVALGLGLGGHREALEHLGVRRAVDRELGAAEQGLAEHARLEEVEVLLAAHRVLDGEQRLGGRLGGGADLHLEEVRLGEVLESVAGGVRGELVEVDGVVDLGELVVQQRRVAAREHALGLAAHEGPEPVLSRRALEQEAQQGPRLRDALARVGELGGVEDEHVAQRLAQAPAGQGVVADVGHAGLVQRLAADREQAIADRRRHPRVHAVGDDVVKAARWRRELLDRPRLEGHVLQAERGHERLAARDGLRRGVDAHEARAGQRERHRHEVAGVAAAELEDAAARGRRGAQAEERGERRQAIGVRLGERVPRIGDRVVRRPRSRPRSAQNALLVLRSQPTRIGATLPLAVCSR